MIPSASPPAGTRELGAIRPITVLYLGCPQAARAEAEKHLAALRITVMWADSSVAALAELQRRDVPVLADFARGGAVLEPLRELRAKHPAMLLVAIVDPSRPDLANEASLARSGRDGSTMATSSMAGCLARNSRSGSSTAPPRAKSARTGTSRRCNSAKAATLESAHITVMRRAARCFSASALAAWGQPR